ncbi:OsWAK receptor-like protein kinase, partial [Musa troglodytarum]
MGWVELLLLLLKLSSMGSTKAEIASTKAPFDLPSNCTKRCGTIDIEYPFGIGTGCYREGFNLTCTDNTTKPLRLFLGDGKLEITRIDLDNGTVRVKTPIITMGVDQESIHVPLIDLQKWPYSLRSLYQEVQNFYTIDTYNRLYVSGCSVVADLVDPTTNRTISTCITRCTSNDNSQCTLSLYDWNNTSLEVRLTRLNQSDLHLLNASIIKVFVYDYYNSTTDDLQGIVKGSSSEVETALSWYIKDYPTCEEAKKNTKTYACINPNSDCYDVINYAYTNYNFGYICRCSLNHKGNPYLANGCTEIASTKAPFALPSNCTKRCGTIDIEYPFGIGTGCYREGFNLTCTYSTTKPPRLFLGDGKLEITGIDLDNGTVGVKTPIITMGVDQEFIDVPVIADVVDPTINRTVDTCTTRCTSYDNSQCTLDLNDWNSTLLEVQLTRLDQSDLHLLNASIIKVFVYNSYNATIDLQGIVKGSSSEVETVLSWYIKDSPTCEEAKKNMETFACNSPNSNCYDVLNDAYTNDSFGYICRCSLNQKGNPYLANGCKDTSSLLVPRKGCPTECGGVNIPFPFGLEEHCYRNQAFALTCNKTSNPPTLLFQGHYIVHNISLEDGQLVASAPNGTTTSYSYGSYTYDYDYLDATGPFTQLEQLSTFSWVIESQNCEEARQNERTFACVGKKILCVDVPKTSTKDIWGYRCNCAKGYQGNPYISDGCKDIDECSFPNKYVCNGTCRNTIGGYECLPDKRQTCENKRERLVKLKHEWCCAGVIIGVSTGSGLLLLSISFITLRRKWKTRKQKKI